MSVTLGYNEVWFTLDRVHDEGVTPGWRLSAERAPEST